jgi:hypothetical protein
MVAKVFLEWMRTFQAWIWVTFANVPLAEASDSQAQIQGPEK